MNQVQGQGPQDRNFQNMPQGTSQSQEATGVVEDTFNRGHLCGRCRQYGHFQWQCPVRMDHSRNHLN